MIFLDVTTSLAKCGLVQSLNYCNQESTKENMLTCTLLLLMASTDLIDIHVLKAIYGKGAIVQS
jgi:hypothetical protein